MIFSLGWLAVLFIWCSGLLAGRAIAAAYAGSDSAPILAALSLLIVFGVALRARTGGEK